MSEAEARIGSDPKPLKFGCTGGRRLLSKFPEISKNVN